MFAIDTPKVKALVEKNGVVPMVADWTDESAQIKAKLDELQSRSIPLLVIYPAGRPQDVIVLRDLVTEGQVLEALEKAGRPRRRARARWPARSLRPNNSQRFRSTPSDVVARLVKNGVEPASLQIDLKLLVPTLLRVIFGHPRGEPGEVVWR